MEAILLYALAVYFSFHLVSRSDLLARPRGWLVTHLPSWLTYPLECGFCYTWWITIPVVAALWWLVDNPLSLIGLLIVAPVINYLIDLWVRDKLSTLTPVNDRSSVLDLFNIMQQDEPARNRFLEAGIVEHDQSQP